MVITLAMYPYLWFYWFYFSLYYFELDFTESSVKKKIASWKKNEWYMYAVSLHFIHISKRYPKLENWIAIGNVDIEV